MKGIILAGGSGTRLYPLTKVMSKQLQPVYDKPMIYYPLSLLMLGGIKDILIITSPHDQVHFKRLLGDGSHLGIKLTYIIQDQPRGLPEAFLLGEEFIGDDDVTLILGDNLFYGDIRFFRDALAKQNTKSDHLQARVFAYSVADPSAYGVVEFDKSYKVKSIEEKPVQPKSNFAIPGLYIFDKTVSRRAKKIQPSARGETEIVELIKDYLNDDVLGVQLITRGVAWLDTGTPKALLEASEFIGAIEARQGLKVGCLEEISLRSGFLTVDQLELSLENYPKGQYKDYIKKIVREYKDA